MGVPVTIEPLTSEHWDWVVSRAHPILCEDTTGFVAKRGEEIVGAVVLDSWSPNSCSAHVAIEDPRATRRLLETACDFVFCHAKRGVVIGVTPSDNERALAFNRKAGFTELYRIPDGMRVGIDYVVQEMRKETCKWIRLDSQKAA